MPWTTLLTATTRTATTTPRIPGPRTCCGFRRADTDPPTAATDARDQHIADLERQLAAAEARIREVEQQRLELAATVTDVRAFAAHAEQFAAKIQRRVA